MSPAEIETLQNAVEELRQDNHNMSIKLAAYASGAQNSEQSGPSQDKSYAEINFLVK